MDLSFLASVGFGFFSCDTKERNPSGKEVCRSKVQHKHLPVTSPALSARRHWPQFMGAQQGATGPDLGKEVSLLACLNNLSLEQQTKSSKVTQELPELRIPHSFSLVYDDPSIGGFQSTYASYCTFRSKRWQGNLGPPDSLDGQLTQYSAFKSVSTPEALREKRCSPRILHREVLSWLRLLIALGWRKTLVDGPPNSPDCKRPG